MRGAVCRSYVSMRARTTSSRSSARIVRAEPQRSQIPSFLGRFMSTWYTASHFGHTRRPVFRLMSSSGSRNRLITAKHGAAREALRLGDRPGESVEDEPLPSVRLLEPAFRHRDYEIAGNELARIHVRLRFLPEIRALRDVLPEDVPRRDARHSDVVGQFRRLGPLPRPGRPQEHETHPPTEGVRRSKDFGPSALPGAARGAPGRGATSSST